MNDSVEGASGNGSIEDVAAAGGGEHSASGLESSTLLLRRAQEGDLGARDRILARYYPRLLRWASGRLPPSARSLTDTPDLVQETILKTMRNLRTLEIPARGGLLPYLRVALRNLIRDRVRTVSRRGRKEPLPEEVTDPQPSPVEEILGRQFIDRYEAALATLRPEEQQGILLRVELDCSWGLIAQETGKLSADAARMAVTRALLRLAEAMTDVRELA